MNQQEIFQNMTKGEWRLKEASGFNAHNYDIFHCALGGRTQPKKLNELANAAAIASAVNNTYGKGINPESVEKMKEALEKISTGWMDGDQMRRTAKEALTAAKL